uniref:Glycerophosphocholine acyltransferase 1 n=1 Tax=Lotharella globosa TaxID=91324 RepID=A0A7S3YXL4_9EUKA|eukprot:CAMPEP_0167832950 /NCGR_PEP_ID=MMETSP0112_2-20121227/14691_1 /TAXON_ID=91324 /ORGANISM="Lotharella globosa, Strain CCCM811" /LENGTH=282 /DNA_ID=CAMNT_0007738195 /DNA_START=253 /DNA_END=1101 /DNA_ORIENTATION=-
MDSPGADDEKLTGESAACCLCCRNTEEEETWSFTFKDDEVGEFVGCRISDSLLSWALFRSLYAVFMFVVLVLCAIQYSLFMGGQWLYFLTMWTFIIQTFYAIFSAYATWAYGYFAQYDPEPLRDPPGIFYALWITENLLLSFTFFVFIGFWAIVFPAGVVLDFTIVATHGVNWVLMLTDRYFSTMPAVRMKHVYVPITYGMIYYLWSIIHAYSGLDNGPIEGKALYPITDYNNHPLLLLSGPIAILIFIPLVHYANQQLVRLSEHCLPRPGQTTAEHHVEMA